MSVKCSLRSSYRLLAMTHLALYSVVMKSARQLYSASSWPSGTITNASSTSNRATNNVRYDASNAIDGRFDDFWNDATENRYPDSLTLLMPTEFTLEGIILISSSYGWLKDYIVETESNTVWSRFATLANCTRPFQLIIFPNSVNTKALRITVTLTQQASKNLFSRINEIIPVVADNIPGTTTSLDTFQPSSTAKSSSPSGTILSGSSRSNSTAKSSAPSGSPTQKPQPQTILAGRFGGILGVILLVLVVVLLGKRRSQIVSGERYATHHIGALAKPSSVQELQDTSPYPELAAW